jgi:hypothetical protein
VQKSGYCLSRFALHARKYVAICVEGDRDRRVAEAFTDNLRVDAGLQGVRGMRMPQVVQANAPDPSETHAPLKVVAEQRGVDRVPILGGKDKAVIVDRRRGRAMCAKERTRPGVERDQPPAALRLWRRDPCLVVDLDNCLDNVQFASGSVDVAPA